MKTLSELLSVVEVVSIAGRLSLLDREVKGLTSDSRTAGRETVFVALEGNSQDGHLFVRDAWARGCRMIVVEKDIEAPRDAAVVRVRDSHRAYGEMAADFFSHPGREVNMIALTGTNGKTTTSWIIENLLREEGKNPGVIGTVNYRFAGPAGRPVVREAALTTPEPVILHRLLREMADAGVTDVVMEVSSHALAQKRLAGVVFDIGIFTNLSRDHLDYHQTMEEYFAAKCSLFLDCLKEDSVAVVVVDSALHGQAEQGSDWGRLLVRRLREGGFHPFAGKKKNRTFIVCGFSGECAVRTNEPVQDIRGFTCSIETGGRTTVVASRLIGRHNVLNMLAAAGVGYAVGMNPGVIGRGLSGVGCVPGRLERVVLPHSGSEADGPFVFVDYAHTPDALENVLLTLRRVAPGRLICVFGCGGNRDKGKRALMGGIAGRLADRILVTSDNPRMEDPLVILGEIEEGLRQEGVAETDIYGLMDMHAENKQYAILEDRRQAIRSVCSMAQKTDVVLIAGKGHETYQIKAGEKRFFDDRIEAQNGRLRWTVEHLLAATSGFLEQRGSTMPTGEVTTDTRTMRNGDIFLALEGENFDGHDFVAEAVGKGAAVCIVSKSCRADSRATVLKVRDTLKGLGDLAAYRRRLLGSKILVTAITGSSGKTTVKEMTAAIFEQYFQGSGDEPVLKTRGNFNNLVGMPLSLLRADAGHRIAVLEMGMNRPGEIGRMAEIAKPDIGCITNVQAAHLEGLGSIEGVARAKGELFTAMPGTGMRIVNFDDRHIRLLGGHHGNNVIGFAVTPAGRKYRPAVRATRIVSRGTAGMRFTLHIGKWRKRFTVPATGEHNVANCAAAAAIATAAGIGPEVIAAGLVSYRSGDKRLQISDLPNRMHVLNDSYNANPSSMAAALRTVIGFDGSSRKIAALGDMLELGSASAESHRAIGALVGDLGFDFLAVTGNFAAEVVLGARGAGMKQDRIMHCDSTDDIARRLAGLIAEKRIGTGDWLLIKGSRGMRMEQVLDSLHRLLGADR